MILVKGFDIMKKFFKHLHLVNKHRFYVFKLAVRAGIPLRGVLHDLSKYSYDEFIISARYFDGHKSPIHVMRCELGYSTVWLHHKGRNKHHFEYWEDISGGDRIGVFMPYKYLVEALCDKIAAGMVYRGKEWSKEEPLIYWQKRERDNVIVKHPGCVEFIDITLTKLSNDGLKSVLNSKYLKGVYHDIKIKYEK